MKSKMLALDNLPKATSYNRELLLKVSKDKVYKDALKQRPIFFSEEELKEIENRYEKKGMTLKDIMAEGCKKFPIKESTLKSYIQKGQLPGPEKQKKIKGKGMISIYPANTIRQLNFVRYCLFSGDTVTDILLELIKDSSSSDLIKLEEASVEIDDSGMDGDDCMHSVYIGLNRLETGLAWITESIEKAFSGPQREQYLLSVKKLMERKENLDKEVNRFKKTLEKSVTPIDLKKELLAAKKCEEET
jgi:hypothetical protein